MPVGLAYLAASLREIGHVVQIFDALADSTDNFIVPSDSFTRADSEKVRRHPRWKHLIHWGSGSEDLENVILEFQPDIVGVSCMFSPYYETAYEVTRLAKRVAPGAWTILGGSHPTAVTEHAVREASIDVVALGEAEVSLPILLSALEQGADLRAVRGVAFRCEKGLCSCPIPISSIHNTARAAWVSNLDGLLPPAADLLNLHAYADTATIITSRGCPFSCTFCTVHAMVGKEFRARSPRCVVDEMENYGRLYSIRKFSIEDDNFTFDIGRVIEICGEIEKRGLQVEIHLPNGMTVIGLTPDLTERMAGAGFRSLFLGLETTNPKDLRRIRKGFTSMTKVAEGVHGFEERGVRASASLITGLPGHDIQQVADDCVRLAVEGVPFGSNPFYPIPGSADYGRFLQSGLIADDTELALFEGFNFAVGNDSMSPAELYWTWAAAQAISQWPQLLLDIDGSSASRTTLTDAIGKLISASTSRTLRRRGYEYLAVPVQASGNRILVSDSGCFCTFQKVRERRLGGGPIDFCIPTGDILAMAIAILVGENIEAIPVGSNVHRPGEGCRFELRSGSSEESAKVGHIFRQSIASTTT